MRPIYSLTFILIASLLTACDGAVTEPPVTTAEAEFKVDSIDDTWVLLDAPYTAFYACANDGQGELLHGWGTWTINLYGHFTPSGVRAGRSRAIYSGLPSEHSRYMGPDYLLIGETTNDVWVVDGNRSQFKEKRVNLPDGSSGYHQTLNLFARRADGERLHIQGSYTYKWEDGAFKMYHVNRGACPEVW